MSGAYAKPLRAVPGLTRDLLVGLEEVPGQARDGNALKDNREERT